MLNEWLTPLLEWLGIGLVPLILGIILVVIIMRS